MKGGYFYIIFCSFVFSIFVCSFVKVSNIWTGGLFFVSLIIFLFSFYFKQFRKKLILLTIIFVVLALGIWRYNLTYQIGGELFQKLGKFSEISGIIIDEPASKGLSQRFILKTKNEKILVSTSVYPKFKYGDRVLVKGKLEKPKNFLINEKEFDYISYLAKDGIQYEISFAKVSLIESGQGNWLINKLFKFKNIFVRKINTLIKEPESALLSGLLLGEKSSLGKEWQEKFARTGVSHIVALSGYNLTIVAEAVIYLLSFLPRFLSLSGGAIGIILFALMIGGSATVLRASIMALLVILARVSARTYDVTRALCLAGLIMLIHNPRILVFDLSFQLSFLATLALIFVSPIVDQFLKRFNLFNKVLKPESKAREIIVSTLATQLFVLPFIIYKFGLVSIVALPVNLIILPVIPLIMLLGFITGTLALISFYLALPTAYLSSLLLSFVLSVINFSSSLPLSAVNIKHTPLFIVVGVYILYIYLIWRSKSFSPPRTNLN